MPPSSSSRADAGGAVAIGLVVLALLGQWMALVVVFKVLGSGTLSAETVLSVGGLLAAPVPFIIFMILALGDDVRGAVRVAGNAGGALVMNIGLICAKEATPIRDETYIYSLVDRHPGITGCGLLVAGLLLIGGQAALKSSKPAP